MTTTGVTSRAVQAARTRDQILDAALAAVDELGLDHASASEIARRAGTTWGAIQHHFGTRDELLLSLIERSFWQLSAVIDEAAVEGSSVLDRLQVLADLIWSHCRDPRYRVSWEIILDVRRRTEAWDSYARRLARFERAMDEAWARLLSETVGTDGDKVVLRTLFAAMRGFALDLHTNPRAGESTQERAYLVRVIADDLARRFSRRGGTAGA